MKRIKKSGRVEPIYKLVGRRIKYSREANHWSQAKLGQLLKPKYTRAGISALENGLRRAPLHVYYAIADAFDYTIDRMLP